MDKPQMRIGYSWDTRAGVLDSAERALVLTEGIEVSRTSLTQLAGPNDVVQFISKNWLAILLLQAPGTFFGQLLKNAADAAWTSLSSFRERMRAEPPLPELRPYGEAAAYAINHPGATAVAVIPTQVHMRSAGIELTSRDPINLAWQLGHLALMADRMAEYLNSLQGRNLSFDQNGDCSIKLLLSDDGTITLHFRAIDGSAVTDHTETFRPTT